MELSKKKGEISSIYRHLKRCLDLGTSIMEEIELKFVLEEVIQVYNITASKYCQNYSLFPAPK